MNLLDPETRALLDHAAIRQLLQSWGFWRDDGMWERLEGAYAPDGVMTTGASSGTAAQFVAFSREFAQRANIRAQHFVGASDVEVHGDRALGQTRVMILLRGMLHGVEVDVTVFARFYDRLIRLADGWRILERRPIYERDRIDTVVPGMQLVLDRNELERYPEGYRHMAYLNNAAGIARTSRNLTCSGDRAELQTLLDAGHAWLREANASADGG
jgi:hypothetical protein